MEHSLKKRDVSQINSTLKTMGFLVDEATFQDFEKLYECSGYFNLQPKDVRVFSFLEVKRKLPSLRQNQLHNKDFNWKGELHNQNAQEFIDTPFDVLIGYYNTKNDFLNAVVAASQAHFKVGLKGADPRLFDLLIDVKLEQMEPFKKELKKYLTVLNKI
nr:hypothetical protein [Marixanthomonas spongiae]